MGKHQGAQTAIGPSQSPSRSLETARPEGRARPPWGEGFGIPESFIGKILMTLFKVCRPFGELVHL